MRAGRVQWDVARLLRVFALPRVRSVSRPRPCVPPASPVPAASARPLPFFALRRLVVPLLALSLSFTAACGSGPGDGAGGRGGQRTEAIDLLTTVRIIPERVTVLGYDRALFGGWAPAAAASDPAIADTRDAVLAEWFGGGTGTPSGTNAGTDAGDAVIADPYTGDDLTADGADVDHVYPLAAAWDFGAHMWDARTRREFANDADLNLVPVASAVNREKSDLTPAEWLPPDRDLRCDYSKRYLRVAVAWRLAVSVADWEAMADACDVGFR